MPPRHPGAAIFPPARRQIPGQARDGCLCHRGHHQPFISARATPVIPANAGTSARAGGEIPGQARDDDVCHQPTPQHPGACHTVIPATAATFPPARLEMPGQARDDDVCRQRMPPRHPGACHPVIPAPGPSHLPGSRSQGKPGTDTCAIAAHANPSSRPAPPRHPGSRDLSPGGWRDPGQARDDDVCHQRTPHRHSGTRRESSHLPARDPRTSPDDDASHPGVRFAPDRSINSFGACSGGHEWRRRFGGGGCPHGRRRP